MFVAPETAIQVHDASTLVVAVSVSEDVAQSSPLSELMITFPVIGFAASYDVGVTVIVKTTASPRLGLASETVTAVVVEEAALATGSSETVSRVESRDTTKTQLLIRLFINSPYERSSRDSRYMNNRILFFYRDSTLL